MKSLKVTQLFKDKESLIIVMAQMCHFAQDHLDSWDCIPSNLDPLLQCTSYQIACFLAQNTCEGHKGVEYPIVISELCEMPTKSIKQWEKSIGEAVRALGGFKS